MIFHALHHYAMHIAKVWFDMADDAKTDPSMRLYSKARGLVEYDRILTGRSWSPWDAKSSRAPRGGAQVMHEDFV
jgi:hypothetical protein